MTSSNQPISAGSLSNQAEYPTTLVDLVDRSIVRDIVAVVGFALLTAAAAQVSIPLGFTPVPLTGQTFAVLLAGGVLGSSKGAASQVLYVAMGAIGLPFYSDGTSGLFDNGALVTNFGYLVGFIVAAWVVGLMAERNRDRNVLDAIPAFLAGTVIIYVFGATFLAWTLDIPLAADLAEPSALKFGIAPFIIGDVIKAALAGLLLPAGWRLFKR